MFMISPMTFASDVTKDMEIENIAIENIVVVEEVISEGNKQIVTNNGFKESLLIFLKEFDLILILSIGIGIIGTMIIMILVYIFSDIDRAKFSYLHDMKGPINRFKRKIKRKLKNQQRLILDKKERYLILFAAFLIGTTSGSLKQLPKHIIMGVIAALIIILLFQRVRSKNIHIKKIKEIAILFEAIELYMRAGYSMYQAIRISRFLVIEIKPEVELCLAYWSAGPKTALLKFQEALNIAEAETLILMLINLENSGSKDMQKAIDGEIINIESIQKMKESISIANKPLVLMVYRMLPLASVLGITVGALIYRTFMMLETSLNIPLL